MDESRAKHLPILVENPRELAESFAHPPGSPGELAFLPLPATRESRDRLRSRRKRAVRAKTVSLKQLTKRELALGRLLYPEAAEASERPLTREGCQGGERPCPFVSCAHHLYLDVSPKTGNIKLNFPDLEVAQMGESCALDVADRGGETLERVGEILNLTRERVRQIETTAHGALRARGHLRAVASEQGFAGGEGAGVVDEGEEEDERAELELEGEFDVDGFVGLEDAGRGPEAA